jgi:PIN domain nuclease of toxin-antitoxin system
VRIGGDFGELPADLAESLGIKSLTLLLDTYAALWWMAGEPDRIDTEARAAMTGQGGDPVSAFVIWEIAGQATPRKARCPHRPPGRLEQAGVDLLPITARHADRVGTLPMHHQDPFDRLLVAQANTDGLTLVSGDGAMQGNEARCSGSAEAGGEPLEPPPHPAWSGHQSTG